MDKNAFSQTYEEYATEIYRFCVHKTGNKEDAEDLVSRVFTKLYEQNDNIENPRAWLYRVTRNMLYDKYVRNNKKDHEAEMDEEIEAVDLDSKVEEQTIEESLVATIQDSIDKLSSDTADIVTMRVWDEMSFQEIAEAVEMKEASARKRFHRGIAELKSIVNAKQHTKGLSTITVSMLLAGTLQLGKVKAFSLSQGFTVGLFNTLGIPIMNLTQTAVGGAAGTGLFATASAKVAAAAIASVAVIAGGAGIAVVSNNQTEPVEPQIQEGGIQESSKTFESEYFGFSLELEDSWGDVTSNYVENEDPSGFFCKEEDINLQNLPEAELAVIHGYPECPGAYGGPIVDMFSVITLDEREVEVTVFENSTYSIYNSTETDGVSQSKVFRLIVNSDGDIDATIALHTRILENTSFEGGVSEEPVHAGTDESDRFTLRDRQYEKFKIYLPNEDPEEVASIGTLKWYVIEDPETGIINIRRKTDAGSSKDYGFISLAVYDTNSSLYQTPRDYLDYAESSYDDGIVSVLTEKYGKEVGLFSYFTDGVDSQSNSIYVIPHGEFLIEIVSTDDPFTGSDQTAEDMNYIIDNIEFY